MAVVKLEFRPRSRCVSLSLPSRYPVRFPTEIQQLYLLRYLTLSGRHSMPSSHAENGRAEGFAYRITLSSLHRLHRNIVHYHECSHMVNEERDYRGSITKDTVDEMSS